MRQNKPSFFSQLWVLTVRSFDILSNDIKHLGMLIVLPILSAIVIIMVGKEEAFLNYEATQVNIFSIVCAVIFIGIFNSIQDVCNERSILKREYMTNLRLDAYICSKLITQFVICSFQTLIITIMFFRNFDFPLQGIVFYSSAIDGYVTILLLMLASAMTGIFISSIVRSAEVANLVAPIVILLQIVFSDNLTDLKGTLEKISYFMLSRWGMSGLSAISRLNEQKSTIQLLFPTFPLEIEREINYASTNEYLIKVWLVLIIFSLVFTFLSGIVISNVSKDSR